MQIATILDRELGVQPDTYQAFVRVLKIDVWMDPACMYGLYILNSKKKNKKY